MRSFFVLLLFLSLGNISLSEEGVKWTDGITLEKDFELKWFSDDPIWVTMEMKGPTKGYLAVGFSPHGSIHGADIVMGWVDSEGIGHIKDLHGIAKEVPKEDKEKNYELLLGEEKEGFTVIRFKRKWNTCDVDHDREINNDTVRLIWSMGLYDPEDKSFEEKYHAEFRGAKSVYLTIPTHSSPFPSESDLNSHVKVWNVHLENNTIDAEETTYFCKIVKFPNLTKKHHAIAFRPLIEEKNKEFVHHMVMSECFIPEHLGGTESVFEKFTSHPGGRCYTVNMPLEWSLHCVTAPFGWGLGSEGDSLPENVGFPLGEKHNGATYFKFEIHYDNPKRKSFTDSSGFRIFYTDKLREFDANTIWMGNTIKSFPIIPPKMPEFTSIGICSSECTKLVFPPDGITLFKVILHAHLSARKIALRHIRNGVELDPISQDNHYDFNYQQTRVVKPKRKVLPGDQLIASCTYDTTTRNTPLYGGLSTSEEMCLVVVYYYPRVNLAECNSQPEYFSFMNALGFNKYSAEKLFSSLSERTGDYENEIESNKTKPIKEEFEIELMTNVDKFVHNPTFRSILHQFKWGDDNRKIGHTFEKRLRDGQHRAFCTGHGRHPHQLQEDILKVSPFLTQDNENKNICASLNEKA